jgi:hypothetical protein
MGPRCRTVRRRYSLVRSVTRYRCIDYWYCVELNLRGLERVESWRRAPATTLRLAGALGEREPPGRPGVDDGEDRRTETFQPSELGFPRSFPYGPPEYHGCALLWARAHHPRCPCTDDLERRTRPRCHSCNGALDALPAAARCRARRVREAHRGELASVSVQQPTYLRAEALEAAVAVAKEQRVHEQ